MDGVRSRTEGAIRAKAFTSFEQCSVKNIESEIGLRIISGRSASSSGECQVRNRLFHSWSSSLGAVQPTLASLLHYYG